MLKQQKKINEDQLIVIVHEILYKLIDLVNSKKYIDALMLNTVKLQPSFDNVPAYLTSNCEPNHITPC